MEWSLELGIKELTVFALSTDNLKRSQVEVETLMRLARDSFARMADNGGFMEQNGIKVKILGDLDLLPEDVRLAMLKAEDQTKNHDKATLNVCLCYNSKHEILSAFESVVDLHAQGKLPSQEKDKNAAPTVADFEAQLYGGKNIRPDILIRTSNEIRLSNFMLYQTDESQYYFVDALWPDFSMWDFTKIIMEYQSLA